MDCAFVIGVIVFSITIKLVESNTHSYKTAIASVVLIAGMSVCYAVGRFMSQREKATKSKEAL
jgi:uncharacterized membrane protein